MKRKEVPAAEKVLLEPKDVKPSVRGWVAQGVFNPAAVRLPDKRIMLYARVSEMPKENLGTDLKAPVIVADPTGEKEGYRQTSQNLSKTRVIGQEGNLIYLKDETCRLKTSSHFRRVFLDQTGFEVEKVDDLPIFTGTHEEGQFGVEDPSITKVDGEYYMTYVSVSLKEGVCTSIAISKNLRDWKRLGIIFREQNKDVTLFPEKIGGEFVALHRPEGFFEFSKPSIWISHSKDLIYWGREKSIIQPRQGCWESERIGSGTSPLKLKEGWLEIYHGVSRKRGKRVYSAGAVLLDKNDPQEVIARSPKNNPLFWPRRLHEKKGYINNVVFPSEAIFDLDKKYLLVFGGAADSVTTVKRVAVQDILDHMVFAKR